MTSRPLPAGVARRPLTAGRFVDWLLAVLFVALAVTLPLWAREYWVRMAATAVLACSGAISMVLLKGYAGQVSLGGNAFLAIGAITTGILARDARFLPFPVVIALAGLVAGLSGIVAGVPSFRLKGLYLALATFAFQDVVLLIIKKAQGLTGGNLGLAVSRPALFGLSFRGEGRFYYLTLAVTAIAALLTWNLLRGRYGRAWTAVRNRELAAAAVGVDVRWAKMTAFFVSSVLLAVTGSLYAYHVGFIAPDDFDVLVGVEYISMAVFGGISSIPGAVIGAVFFTFLPDLITLTRPALQSVMGSQAMKLLPFAQQLIYGLVVMLFLIYRHDGVVGLWRSLRRRLDAGA